MYSSLGSSVDVCDGVDATYVAEELRSKIRGSKIGNLEPPGAVAPFAPSIVK